MWSAVGLIVVALMVGLVAGAVTGGFAGYQYANRNDGTATTQTGAVAQATQAPTQTPQTTPSTTSGSATTTDPTPSVNQSNASTQSYNEVVAKVNPAIVTVINHLKSSGNAFGQSSGGEAMGTGMIIDKEGHIVTNAHVVDQQQSLEVQFSDGTKVPATLVGADTFQDVAVIKVSGSVPATVTFGDSSKLQPGQRVIAIGSALGEFNNTVTDGIVSATDRSLDTGEGYRLPNLVQHDAPINHGNSGGPLINLDGQVIGMNTAIVTGGGMGQDQAQGLGFAIESNVVKSYAQQLIANGKIDHPYLGISFQPASQLGDLFGSGQSNGSNDNSQGVVIAQILPDSPAAKAGLQEGDIITGVDNTTFDDQHPFLNTMYTYKPGDSVTLKVQGQDGTKRDVKVTLGQQPSDFQQS